MDWLAWWNRIRAIDRVNDRGHLSASVSTLSVQTPSGSSLEPLARKPYLAEWFRSRNVK